MLKQGTFVNKKFNKLLMGSIWGCLAFGINVMTDSLISGNQLGETSLEAVSIVFPLFAVIHFFSELVPSGASVLFGKHIGEFNDEEAYRSAGTSVWFSVLTGLIVSLTLWFIKIPLLRCLGCTDELLTEAVAYYNWVIPYAFLKPISLSNYYLFVTDGESTFSSIGSIADIVTNVLLSIVLSDYFGVAGLGMATCIGRVLNIIFSAFHFFRKSNNVKIRFCIDFKTLKRSIYLSFSSYMYYLFIAVVDIVFNKKIITNCGVEYLPAYSVVNLVFSVCEIFLCLYEASVGFITCFYGEKNNHGLKIVLRKLTKSIVIMGVCLSLFFFFGAPLMPKIYGLETPITIQASIMACRIMSFTCIGYGFIYIFTMVLSSVEKPLNSFFMSLLGDGVSPLLLALVCGLLWNFTGIVIGMCLSTYFAILLYSVPVIVREGRKGYPLYLDDYGEEGFSYDLYVTPESLVELRDAVSAELKAHGYDVKNVELLLEEFFTRVMEKNSNKKILAECSLLFREDSVRVLIRNDGVLFNFLDENNKIESLNTHVLNSLLLQTEDKNYIVTTRFNRNEFVFDK